MNYITVFTPTFNRGHIIEKLYKSLRNQTCKNFEWIVIDDGSTDNTKEIFREILNQKNDFPIHYYTVKNGGKHRAINKAVNLANGSHMFIVDSDDYIVNDAIETIYNWLEDINDEFAGVSGLRGYDKTTPMGNIDCFINDDFLDKTNIERRYMNSLDDMAEIYRIDILKKFPFIEIEGEKFITESVVWDEIAYNGYKIRWHNKIIYICNYLEDGLTKSGKKIFIENPKGYAYRVLQDIKYNNYNFKKKCIIYYEFYYDMKDRYDLKYIAKLLRINPIFLKIITLYVSNKF